MDNDPELFWNSFKNAVRQQMPACAESLELLKFPVSLKEYDSAIRSILDEARTRKIIMVFDNLEHITSLQILQFINIIVEVESPDLCVIIISNQRLTNRFSPKSSNRCHIDEVELAFTPDESRQLSEQFELNLSQTEIDSINKSVNGWPYPLHLVFMELKHHKESYYSGAVMQQLIFEKFEQHYYQNYSYKIQKLFIIFSLLPRISLSLIMELGIEIDGEIMQILTDNIFVTYDSITHIYSLNKLYQDFLYSKRELFSKDEIFQIIDRSGNWYLENDKFHDSLASFWINRDYDKYLNALSHLYVKYHDYDTTQHILKILNQFPSEYCEKNLIVTYSRAFFYLNIMQVQKGRQLFLEMIPNLLNQPEEQTMLGNIFYSLADISNLRNDDKGLAYIQKAMELLPHGCNLRSRELLIVENNELFFLPDTKSGRLEEMIEYQIEFAKCADFLCNGSGMGYEMQFAAEACYFSGQFTRALEYAQRAESKAAIEHQYDIICNALFIKMRIALFTGNLKAALGYLDEITYYSQQQISLL